jgi:GxxExxY protein
MEDVTKQARRRRSHFAHDLKLTLGIPFRAKQPLMLTYKERVLKKTYDPDLTCFEKVVVEIKAVSQLIDDHRAQAHNYLKATGYRLALLVNFGAHRALEYERIAR